MTTKTPRARIAANTQDVRLRTLAMLRYRDRPFDAPLDFDPADAPWLAVLEAGEHLLRTVRIARVAARGDEKFPWHRRAGVVGEVVNAFLADFADGGSENTDRLYRQRTAAEGDV